jgi:hypothetical protein
MERYYLEKILGKFKDLVEFLNEKADWNSCKHTEEVWFEK